MAAAVDDEVRLMRVKANQTLRLEHSFDRSMGIYWGVGRLSGCERGPDLPSETALLRQHEPGLDESRFATLRELIVMLHDNSVGFAKKVIKEDTALAQQQPGPSEQDLKMMRANVAALRRMCAVLKTLAEVTPPFMTKLPQVGVAQYLQRRILQLCFANLECIDAVVGHHECRVDAYSKITIKAAVLDFLSWQDRAKELNFKKQRTAGPEPREIAELLLVAKRNRKEAKMTMQAEELKLEHLEMSSSNQPLRLVKGILLIKEAEKVAWELHQHGERKFGDRVLSLWSIQKEVVLASSANELSVRLAKELCSGNSRDMEQLSVACVASIAECVQEACMDHYHHDTWNRMFTPDKVRAAIAEELQNEA